MDETVCILIEARPGTWYYAFAHQPTPHDWRRAQSARAVGPFDDRREAEEHAEQRGLRFRYAIPNSEFMFDIIWHDLFANAHDPLFDRL